MPELSFCCIWSSMACIFLISWSFWWRSIIVSGSSYSLSVGAILSLDIQISTKVKRFFFNLFEDIRFRSMLVSPTAIPFRDKKLSKFGRIWKVHLRSQLSKTSQPIILVMNIVRHILQILGINQSNFELFLTQALARIWADLHVSLNQKSFEEDKVAMLRILYIHHSPGILESIVKILLLASIKLKIRYFLHHCVEPAYLKKLLAY